MKSVAAATLLAATLVHPAAAVFAPRNRAELITGIIKCLNDDSWENGGHCTNLANKPVPSEQGSGESNKYGLIGDWDVSKIKDMHGIFSPSDSVLHNARHFNQDLSRWDVSSVRNIHSMFYAATAFDQDLSSWDVSKVTDMRYMFTYAESFSQTLCGEAWVNSDATKTDMFEGAGISLAQAYPTTACTACDNTDGTAINSGQLHDKCICGGTAYCSSGTGLVCDETTDPLNPTCGKTVTCAAGKFADGDDCTDCSEGSYQDEAGAAGCKLCGEDKLSVAGSTSASACFGVEEAAAALAQEYKEVVDKAWEDARGQC